MSNIKISSKHYDELLADRAERNALRAALNYIGNHRDTITLTQQGLLDHIKKLGEVARQALANHPDPIAEKVKAAEAWSREKLSSRNLSLMMDRESGNWICEIIDHDIQRYPIGRGITCNEAIAVAWEKMGGDNERS